MYKKIELETEDGTEEFGFKASGATAIYYRTAFGRDLIVDLMALNSGSIADVDTTAGDRLAYIMNAQAEKREMSKLNMDDFIEWADHFEGSELQSHLNEFTSLYFSSRKTTSKAKKEDARQNAN